MTKRDKREQLHDLLVADGFGYRIGKHYNYEHRQHTDIKVTVARPHGGAKHVKAPYVLDALAALDAVRRRDGEQE